MLLISKMRAKKSQFLKELNRGVLFLLSVCYPIEKQRSLR